MPAWTSYAKIVGDIQRRVKFEASAIESGVK
jgi:hypothetical protein